MFTVGLLLPRSTLFPSFGLDILAGIKKHLQLLGIADSVSIRTDNIGFGENEQEVYTKAEKMILQEDADVVIAVADNRVTEILQPLFTATNKILIIVNCGTDVSENWSTAPTTLIHTLNFSLCSRLTGMMAASDGKKETVNLLSYYDAGYFQCFSMLNGNQEMGGVPALYHITKLRLEDFTIEPLETYLNQEGSSRQLLCLFCGEQAERFYKEVAPLQQKYDCHLFVSPMMLDEQLKSKFGSSFQIQQVSGYVPWHSSINNEANCVFIKEMQLAGKTASYFSLLGWDTGAILHKIGAKKQEGINDAAAIIRSFTETTFESPRGWIKMDADSNYMYGPVHKVICYDNFNTRLHKESQVDIEKEFASFKSVKVNVSEASSWKNTYLCI